MLSPRYTIHENTLVTDIVIRDYRTADVLRKHNIDFCCGGKWPLYVACESRGLDTKEIQRELEEATREIHVSPSLPFNEWPLDFLTDYIGYVHHAFLKEQLPAIKEQLGKFAEGHRKKYPFLDELEEKFKRLHLSLIPHLKQEEEIIFPYIKRLSRAYNNKEPYAGLLVRTLRKPVEDVMQHEHEIVGKILLRFRELTDNYTPPPNACVSHRVTWSKLRELDSDLVQHVHLENNILFPRALAMEKELIQKGDH